MVGLLIDSDVPLLLALTVAALIVVLVSSSSSKRRPASHGNRPHACPGCGTVHPGYASYCRRCGARLA